MPTNPTPRSLLTPLLLASLLPSSVALADDPLRCSFSSGGGSSNPPSGRIEVTIHSLDLNDDMEIDVWPFDNRADVYGVIDINADGTNEDFHLPEISGSDFPHWTEGNKFVSRPATPGVPVRVVIHMREADLQFSDIIDTSPDPAKEDLEFFIDTCSLRITGDITGSMGALPPIRSGNGSNQGTLVIEVGIEGERPLSNTPNDVALSGFDLIQVVPNAGRMVATKPAVALMTVANNAPVSTNVSARVRIRRTGSSVDMYDVTESLGSFAPGEVRSTYVGQSSPFIPPSARCGSYEIDASATLILEPNFEPPVFRPECWTINNSVGLARALVVEPKIPSLLWQPVGFVFDNGATASPAEVAAIREVGLPIIRGTYPLGNITDSVSMIPFTFNPGPSLPVFEALLGFLGLAIEAAHPFSLVFELNVAAAMSGFDRVMGVLPRDWFNNPIFGLWEGTTGLSLGEWLPRAVIFEAESSNDDGTNVGPKPSLPAHELGHTFGLSVDPTIKGWPCSISGNLGIIACGMFGGFDEYNSDTHGDGVPTWGFWVPQGTIPPGLVTGEQCDTTCLMGSNPINAHQDWVNRGSWIDPADYDQLIDRLQNTCGTAPTGAIFVSGLIDDNDNATLAWTFHRQGELRVPDLENKQGEIAAPYVLRFVDGAGSVVGESELPLSWTHPDTALALPVTVFGGFAVFPTDTTRIEIWSRLSGKLLASRDITPNRPVIGPPTAVVTTPKVGNRVLEVVWTASDADQDRLTHFLQIAPARSTKFWPVAHAVSNPGVTIELPAGLNRGSYTARVLTSDGVNLVHRDVTFEL